MKRSAIKRLENPVWGVVDGTDLEVLVHPSQASILTEMMMGADRRTDRKICQKAFTDFRKYTEDDGTPIDNSLEARMELLTSLSVRGAVVRILSDNNDETVLGELSGGTD